MRGCRIYRCCWNWTVFHDKRHWRTVLCESLLWIYSSKKWWTSQPKGWIQGKTRIGPALEFTTICLYGKHGIEIRIWSLSEDNTQSWLRISHGSNKFVIESNNNETEVPEDLPEEQALQLKVKDFACRSKAKSTTAKKRTCWLFTEHHFDEIKEVNWYWTRALLSFSAYEISRKVIHLLRHSQKVQREDDGAVQFWRIKKHLQSKFPQTQYWPDDRWKACLAAGGGTKKRYQYCTDVSGIIIFPSSWRKFRTRSHWSFITRQCCNSARILPSCLPHWMCVLIFIRSSTMDWYLEVRIQARDRRYSFCLLIPERERHEGPAKIDFTVPRRAQYLHNAWKKHQDAVNWVDINLTIRKGLTFYQTRSTAIILQGILPAYCIPKVVRLKTGEVLHENAYRSPRPPPKISLRHDWTQELGSKVVQQPEGKVVQQPEGEVARQAKFFQPTQPIPSPNCDGSGQPDITQDVISVQACSSEDNKSLNVEQTHDRSGQPDKRSDAVHHEIKTLSTDNETIRERIEEDMDFKIPGLPHSIVKQLHGASVRDLIQKIENHPNRHALQRDLRQSHSFNPFSPESKQMVHEVGNIQLCELLDTEPKTQCKVCLSYLDIGIVYCTCGHFLREGREENQKFLLSIPDYVTKKGRPHGHRYGKKSGDKESYIAHQLKKKCKKKYYQGIHDRFVRDDKFRRNMI